jgi:hypothetical protein
MNPGPPAPARTGRPGPVTPTARVAWFVSCARGCLPVLTALSMPDPGPVFTGHDRSHGAEVHAHRREAGAGQGQRLAPRRGQVRSEPTIIDLAGRGAVVTHTQPRSEFTSKATRARPGQFPQERALAVPVLLLIKGRRISLWK